MEAELAPELLREMPDVVGVVGMTPLRAVATGIGGVAIVFPTYGTGTMGWEMGTMGWEMMCLLS